MKEEKGFIEELANAKNIADLRLSYSRVSKFVDNGPKALVENIAIDHDGIKMGKLIDILLFEEHKFNKLYYIYDGNKPTATLGQLCDIIITNYNEIPDLTQVFNIVRDNEFWSNIKKVDTLVNKFDNDEFWSYLTAQFESKDKTIVGTDELQMARDCVEVLKTHEYSKEIVKYPKEHEQKFVQYDIEFQIENFIFKALVDMVIVDHKNKTIQLVDLKTGKNPSILFSSSFVKWRYYLQEAIYQIGALEICKQLDISDYEILPFKFLYISRFEKIPLVFEVGEKWHKAALKGFKTTSGYDYKGLYELIDDIYWHWKNKKYDLPRQVYEDKGLLTLNDNFIEVNE